MRGLSLKSPNGLFYGIGATASALMDMVLAPGALGG